jgi:hypothetical protein
MDVASLAELLHETAEHHDPYEKSHAPHNWWDWYAAYIDSRQHGNTPEEAIVRARLTTRGHYDCNVTYHQRVPDGAQQRDYRR